MQCACAILSSAASPALVYIFSYYLIKGTIFEKTLMKVKCVFWYSLQLLSKIFLTSRRIARDIIKNVYWCSRKVPGILDRVLWKLNFHNRFSKNTQLSNVLKIRPVGAEVFHAGRRTDGQTDMEKLIAAFRNFANAPEHVPLEHRPSNCSSGTRDPKDACGNLNFWAVKISAI